MRCYLILTVDELVPAGGNVQRCHISYCNSRPAVVCSDVNRTWIASILGGVYSPKWTQLSFAGITSLLQDLAGGPVN